MVKRRLFKAIGIADHIVARSGDAIALMGKWDPVRVVSLCLARTTASWMIAR